MSRTNRLSSSSEFSDMWVRKRSLSAAASIAASLLPKIHEAKTSKSLIHPLIECKSESWAYFFKTFSQVEVHRSFPSGLGWSADFQALPPTI